MCFLCLFGVFFKVDFSIFGVMFRMSVVYEADRWEICKKQICERRAWHLPQMVFVLKNQWAFYEMVTLRVTLPTRMMYNPRATLSVTLLSLASMATVATLLPVRLNTSSLSPCPFCIRIVCFDTSMVGVTSGFSCAMTP